MVIQLEDLQREIHRTAKEKGWWPTEESTRNVPEALALIHSEVSEALEEWRGKNQTIRSMRVIRYEGKSSKPEGFAVELADILIRVLDLAYGLDIPLAQALKEKMTYNKTRPYRHGGLAA